MEGEQPRPARVCKREVRRLQVIDAARACFRAQGFHNASMARIAASAGMSVGHIYRYFANKEAVIAAIVEQSVAEKIEHFEAIERAVRDGGQDLAEASSSLDIESGALSQGQEAALMLDILAEASRNPTIASIVQRADARLRERAQDMVAAARPAWSPERVLAAVEIITVLHEGLYVRLIASPGAFGPESRRLRAALISRALQH